MLLCRCYYTIGKCNLAKVRSRSVLDVFNSNKRSQIMRSVHSKDTGVEMRVRSLLHRAGFRYRLHRKDLPGNPDIVFPSRRCVIFVHGCFWHQHFGCKYADRPSSHTTYWTAKLNRNMERDRKNIVQLQSTGWRVMVVWECECGQTEQLKNKIRGFLDDEGSPHAGH